MNCFSKKNMKSSYLDYDVVGQKDRIVDFEASFSTLMRNVYAWMAGGLIVTALTAMIVAGSSALLTAIFSSRLALWGIIFAELGLVWFLSVRIDRLSFVTAGCMFIVYSLLNGLTMSSIFMAYTKESVAQVFFVTAGTFTAMSIVGHVVKKDLSGIGRILIMTLIGLVIATIVNLFMHNTGLSMVLNYVGVAIFVGLTAYDTQKVKQMLMDYGECEMGHKLAVLASLTLYLDFVNLFLYMLRILGNRK